MCTDLKQRLSKADWNRLPYIKMMSFDHFLIIIIRIISGCGFKVVKITYGSTETSHSHKVNYKKFDWPAQTTREPLDFYPPRKYNDTII